MNFFASAIIGGIVYDLIKEGTKLSVKNVFEQFYSINGDTNIYKEFVEEINSIEDVSDKIIYTDKILTEENKYTLKFEESVYKTNFAKRLDYIIMLINDCGYFGEKINLEKLGKTLGFSSVNDLKKYYLSETEPTYEFTENLAAKLAVNVDWIQFGLGKPFESTLPWIDRAGQILFQKDFEDIEEFIFVIDEVPRRRNLGVIRRISNLKYEYYPHKFIFHDDVGGSGESELYSVYRFLKELNTRGKMPSGVYKVCENKYLELFNGEVYPGSIKRCQNEWVPYLLDDFIDLYSSEEQKDNYTKRYGKVFVDSQKIIKGMSEI